MLAACILAALFFHYKRRYGQNYLRLWFLSWVALAVYTLTSAISLAIALHDPLSPFRTPFSIISLIASYSQVVWLLSGTYEVATERPHNRSLVRITLALSVGVAIVSVLVGRNNPDAAELRFFLRIGLRYLATGMAFIISGFFLWRSHRLRMRDGVRIVTGVFFFYGLLLLLVGAHYSLPGLFTGVYRQIILTLSGFDLLAITLIGMGLVMWLLDEEQTRVSHAHRRVRELETQDPLTGLTNRPTFLRLLDQHLNLASPTQQLTAVGVLNLDRFQQLNEALGHRQGDEILRKIADLLAHNASEAELVTRLGGDQYAFALGGFSRRDDAIQVAKALVEPLRFPFNLGDRKVQCQASVGLAIAPNDGVDAETLLRNAHTAQRKVRRSGGNDLLLYSPTLPSRTVEQLDFEEELRVAITSGGFFLRYQPIVSYPSGEPQGAEVLLRWRHPTRGELGPDQFLPLAINLGLIRKVDRWVLEESCRQAHQWNQNGLQLDISVNISASSFSDPRFPDRVRRLLIQFPLAKRCLQLEITEHHAIRDLDAGINTLEALRSLGVPVCIDDFGVGHSSFSLLHRLPIHTIKIDKSFVQRAGRVRREATIVSAMISMAQSLNLSVIAEGVENEVQARMLAEFGCTQHQGFHYHRPLLENEMQALMTRIKEPPESTRKAE